MPNTVVVIVKPYLELHVLVTTADNLQQLVPCLITHISKGLTGCTQGRINIPYLKIAQTVSKAVNSDCVYGHAVGQDWCSEDHCQLAVPHGAAHGEVLHQRCSRGQVEQPV